jgi:hypothetical protein
LVVGGWSRLWGVGRELHIELWEEEAVGRYDGMC